MSNLDLLGLSQRGLPEVVFETTDRLHHRCLDIYTTAMCVRTEEVGVLCTDHTWYMKWVSYTPTIPGT